MDTFKGKNECGMKFLKPNFFTLDSFNNLREKKQQSTLKEHRTVTGKCRFQKMGLRGRRREEEIKKNYKVNINYLNCTAFQALL